jgi:hypothetical protein
MLTGRPAYPNCGKPLPKIITVLARRAESDFDTASAIFNPDLLDL